MKKCACAGKPKCAAGKKAWYEKMVAAKAAKKSAGESISKKTVKKVTKRAIKDKEIKE